MAAEFSHAVRIQTEDFDLGAEWTAQRARLDGRAGAMAAFVGVVRDHFGGQAVQTLTLEHYPGMTENSIHKVVEQVAARYELLDVVVVHRVGSLPAEAQIVLVMAAASHRPDAFAACEMLMDYLKTEAVLWKREAQTGGQRWVQSSDSDHARAQRWRTSRDELKG